jgi:hypothetical protein
MATFETIDVTANIAAAIARATEVQNTMQSANLQSNLRLSNLETSVHKQEQKTNELAKSLKVNESNHQKNKKWTPQHNRQNMGDLTADNDDSSKMLINPNWNK